MPRKCPDNLDMTRAVMSPHGFGSPDSMRQQPISVLNRERIDAQIGAVERRAILDALSAANPGANAPTGETLSAKDRQRIKVLSNRAEKFLADADAGYARRDELLNDAETFAAGAGTAEATFWTNMQNRVAKFFLNSRQGLLQWADTFVRTEGPSYANEFNKVFAAMTPKIRGMYSVFRQGMDSLRPDYVEIARRTGYKVDDVQAMIGEYLTARHAPEANRHLIKGWTKEIQDAEAKLAELTQTRKLTDAKRNELYSIAGEADKKIKLLESHLNDAAYKEKFHKGGYTDAEAEVVRRRVSDELGMSFDELDVLAKKLSGQFDNITGELAKAGLIRREQLEAIPDFEWYVPLMTRDDNLSDPVNFTSRYMPGSRKAREGTWSTPDNAWQTLDYMARSAATEIGMQDFGSMLYAVARRNKPHSATDNGTRIMDMNVLAAERAKGGDTAAMSDALLNMGGLTMDVPALNKDGQPVMKKVYIYFDPNWSSGNLTGKMINEAMSSNRKLGCAALEAVAKLTSYHGQSYTRFNPMFAPVASFRDFMERAFHIATRDYFTEAGERINTRELVFTYIKNTPRYMTMLTEAMAGKTAPGSDAARYLDDFIREGGMQKYLPAASQTNVTLTPGGRTRGFADLLRKEGLPQLADKMAGMKNLKEANRFLLEAGEAGRKALNVLDKWNDIIQNIPAFSQYVALREAGQSSAKAARNTLELMNMSIGGDIATPLSLIAPFVRPTMQGAGALVRSLGLTGRNLDEMTKYGKTGWSMMGIGALVGYGALCPLIRDSLGEDEQGRSIADSMPISKITSFNPVGFGDGEYFKLPMGFGAPRIAAAAAWATDRMFRGIMEPGEAAFEILFAAGRDVVPGNAPAFDFADHPVEFIMQTLCPATLRPFLESSQNLNHFGSPVYNEFDKSKPLSAQGRKSTPPAWHKLARDIYRATGADVAPETYMHTVSGFAAGPLRLITTAITEAAKLDSPRRGWQQESALEGIVGGTGAAMLKTLGYTLLFGKEQNLSAHYYMDGVTKLKQEAMRLGVDATADRKRGAEGDEIVRQKLLAGGMDSEKVEDYILYRNIDKELKNAGREFGDKHKYWYDEEDAEGVKADFLTLFDRQTAAYDRFFAESNMYRNYR